MERPCEWWKGRQNLEASPSLTLDSLTMQLLARAQPERSGARAAEDAVPVRRRDLHYGRLGPPLQHAQAHGI